MKEDILWEKFVLKYVSHLKYFQLYFNMLGRKAIRLLAFFFFFCSNIPLIPTAKLPSNPVSPSCKALLTSGPQLLLQCNDPLTHGSLRQPLNGSSCLHFPPVHQLSLSFLKKKKKRLPSKHFSAVTYQMDCHCPKAKFESLSTR